MGHGIAQVVAGAGHRVLLFEPEHGRAEAGRQRIEGNLERAVAKGKLNEQERQEQLSRIDVAEGLAEAAERVDFAIEAVFEDFEVKRRLFEELDRHAPESAVFASNTSSISITRLATATQPGRRRRFVGMHFFSPVPVMPLVELIRGVETDDETEAAVRELAAQMGKQVILSADRPGFIVNRVLMPLLAEAMRAYQEGLGTPEDIDTGARVGLNHPMGPLELADFIGLDVCLDVMEVLHEGFGAPHFAPPPVLRQLVDAGHLGQKAGRGFYRYPRQGG
jgi:3-hydroxybutyryl-CoA dehydrogenase